MKSILLGFFFSLILICSCEKQNHTFPTKDDGKYFILDKSDLSGVLKHTSHDQFFGSFVSGYNRYVLQGVDKVQSTAMDGGGYFIGITAEPPESPIGYNLTYMGHELLEAPRMTSYCSGASYAAFIEGLNIMAKTMDIAKPDSAHLEAMRLQEPDGGRREDHVKLWGKWNADGFGSHFALVQYAKMGQEVKPAEARPGDFANISWQSGNGHSVVFLSWVKDEEGNKYLLYWSSQKSTNGLSDQLVNVEKIKNIKIVRLTNPEKLVMFDIDKKIDVKQVKGDKIQILK